MALVIGFPFILRKSNKTGVAWIDIRKPEHVMAGIEVYVNSEKAPSRIPIEGVPHARGFLAPLYAQGLEVALLFDGPLESGDLIGSNNSGQPILDFDGPSSTLAQYLASKLSCSLLVDSSERRVLVSGKCNAHDGGIEIQPLRVEGRLEEKCNHIDDWDIWVHRDDFDQLEKLTQEKPNVRPFLADNGSSDWLLEEFCQSYALPLPGGTDGERNDGPVPNERTLFCNAIDRLFFVERDEKLDKYFSKYTARELLPLQTQALEDKNKGLFASMDNRAVRHAFISGPTGCGKTTLMQSLVLNSMHNREGSAVYVGPVKALVEEFHWTILGDDFRHLLADRAAGRVFISTSDYVEHDGWIAKGEFALASMVYEKANILLAGPEGAVFADSLELVVIDETHMLRDGSRGDVVDMLITKIMRQNELRAHNGRQPIQLVMISTEDIAQELKTLPGFKNPCATGGIVQDPILLRVDDRIPPFDHVLCRRVNGHVQTVHLCEFDSQLKRRLDRQEIESLLGKVSRELTVLEPNTGAISDALKRAGVASPREEANTGQFHTNILKFVNWLIHRSGHRSIIVVCNAISLCDTLAAGFANRYRIHRLDKQEVAESFVRVVNDSEFEREKRQRYVDCAEKGVYTHHSQMPARLRSAVAELFRMPIRTNSRPQILFTTETLAYGVNLSASAIILTDLEFLRTDPVNPVVLPSREALTPNQYHNLLGRAGRKSFESKAIKSVAYIQIPDEWQTPAGSPVRTKVYKFLKDYYGKQDIDPSQPLSTIAHREDFMTMGTEAELKAYSYSIFRTILECVRSAGGAGIRKQHALEIFRKTLGYMTANEPLQQHLVRLFECVFDLIVRYRSGALTLLLQTGDRYSVQPTAEALLNTGISVHAVEPIALWLESIKRHGHVAENPALLLLPALVVAPEFTQSANELLHLEQLKRLFGTQQEVEQHTQKCRQLAQSMFMDSGLSEKVFASIDDYLESSPAVAALGIFPQMVMQKACFYLLISGVLVWLRGGSVIEMGKAFTALFPQGVANQRSWQPKHADRLELLVRMTSNFFSQGRGYLTDAMRLALPKFCFQVKFGLPNKALPYRNVLAPSDVVLSRAAILALNNAIDDPFLILGIKPVPDVASVLQQANVDMQVSNHSLQKVVRQTYTRSIETFLWHLGDDRTKSFVEAVAASLKEVDSDACGFTEDWIPNRLMEAAVTSFQSLPQKHVSLEASIDKLQLLAWHQLPSESAVGLTPCAFILINALVARKALSFGDFANVALRSGKRRIDVEWIAAQSWNDQNGLDQFNRLREPLLSFIEPQLAI
jgi:DEAD/DEAH box helicase